MCSNCPIIGHTKETCPNADNPKCLNCEGQHSASSRECPRFMVEKAALQIHAKSLCSLADAHKEVEQTSTITNTEHDSYATAASPLNQWTQPSNRSQDIQNENISEVVQLLKAQNASLQDHVNKVSSRVTELLSLLSALTESIKDMRDNSQLCPNLACPRRFTQPQTTLPWDKQVGPPVGGSHTSVRSTHTPTLQRGFNSVSQRTVQVAPTFIPTRALTPKTKVLLDQSGPGGGKRGLVSPATKPAVDRPQRASSKK